LREELRNVAPVANKNIIEDKVVVVPKHFVSKSINVKQKADNNEAYDQMLDLELGNEGVHVV